MDDENVRPATGAHAGELAAGKVDFLDVWQENPRTAAA
jgi:hypothetical protein